MPKDIFELDAKSQIPAKKERPAHTEKIIKKT
jgi:hypothetical protein